MLTQACDINKWFENMENKLLSFLKSLSWCLVLIIYKFSHDKLATDTHGSRTNRMLDPSQLLIRILMPVFCFCHYVLWQDRILWEYTKRSLAVIFYLFIGNSLYPSSISNLKRWRHKRIVFSPDFIKLSCISIQPLSHRLVYFLSTQWACAQYRKLLFSRLRKRPSWSSFRKRALPANGGVRNTMDFLSANDISFVFRCLPVQRCVQCWTFTPLVFRIGSVH